MATISAAARTMYPHDALPADVYTRVGKKLADAAREDSVVTQTIEDGVSALNGGRPFTVLSADEQLETLKEIEDSELDRGNHFAAWQEPALFTTELRAAFRTLR